MATGEDWLLRPVMRGKCLYESLINGALDLEDIANLNDAIDVEDEIQRRYQDTQDRRKR